MTVIMHSSLARSLAFILANKLQSATLLGTQLTRLFVEAYEVGFKQREGSPQGSAARTGCHVCCAVQRGPSHASFENPAAAPPHPAPPPPVLPRPPLQDDPSLVEAAVADLQAVVDRDPACDTYVQPLLFFKGFQALQAHRVGHWMWQRGRKSLAVALQASARRAGVWSLAGWRGARAGLAGLVPG